MTGVLKGIRVVDFGMVVAGPIPGQIMADMGAEVIKVESMKRVDYMRLGKRIFRDKPAIEQHVWFHNINRGKLSVTIDASHPQGSHILKELVKLSDVVVENFSPGVMAHFGLDYQDLIKVKPDIIMLSMSGAGRNGPLKDIRCYAPTVGALSGLDSLTGYPGGRPLGIKFIYGDVCAALHGLFAVLACLNYRRETGKGQHIDLSMWESQVAVVGEGAMDFTMNQRVMGTQGNRYPTMAPHNLYRCKGEDKWVSIAIKTDVEWDNFCRAIGSPDWTREERFADKFKRMSHLDALDELITQWTQNYTPYEVMDILQRAGVAAMPDMGAEDHLNDPHFKQREAYVQVEHPITGSDVIYNQPFKLSETPGEVRRPAPLMGEYNDCVFKDLLHMSEEEIRKLVEEKVIY